MKGILGVALFLYGKMLENGSIHGLENIRRWIKIAGVLYFLAGITAVAGIFFSTIANILLAFTFSGLFSGVSKDTRKAVAEV